MQTLNTLLETQTAIFDMVSDSCSCLLPSCESWEITSKVCMQIITMDQFICKVSKCHQCLFSTASPKPACGQSLSVTKGLDKLAERCEGRFEMRKMCSAKLHFWQPALPPRCSAVFCSSGQLRELEFHPCQPLLTLQCPFWDFLFLRCLVMLKN